MLRHIIELLQERGRMSLRDLALATKTDPDTLEAMLTILVEKGRITKSFPGCDSGRKSCANCSHTHRYDAIFFEIR